MAQAFEVEDAGEGFFLDDGAGEGGFVALEGADLFFNRSSGENAVRDDLVALTDAVRAVDGLRLDGWIPPRVVQP